MTPRSPDEEDALELGGYLRAFARHWAAAVVGAVIGGGIAFGYASLQPVMFEGVTSLLVVSRTLPSGIQINPAMFTSIVKNATMASQVIDELKLTGTMTPQSFVDNALDTQEVPGTSIVRVGVRLADPALAADASRRVARKAILRTQQLIDQDAESLPDQLKARLDEANARAKKAETDLLNFEQHNQLEIAAADADIMLKERSRLSTNGRNADADARSQLSELYKDQIEQGRLQADLDVARAVYKELAVRYEQARLQPVSPASPLQIMDDAVPPDRPISRKRLQYAAFGAFAGLVIAGLLAHFWERRAGQTPSRTT